MKLFRSGLYQWKHMPEFELLDLFVLVLVFMQCVGSFRTNN